MKTSPYNIIQEIMISEKATEISEHEKYVFKVNVKANKFQVADSIENIYDVKVAKVNIMNCNGKSKRVPGTQKTGRRSNWKKAIVTLSEGSIDIF